MAMMSEISIWPEDFYPGVFHKLVEEFASEFESGRDIDKYKKVRKRGRWLQSSRPPVSSYHQEDPIFFEIPEFPDDINTQFQPLVISKGMPLDVISLLSISTANSDCKSSFVRIHQVDGCLVATNCDIDEDIPTYFMGKYVFLICFYAPILMGRRLMEYSLFAEEMMSKYQGKFETVLAVKMRPKWSNNEAVFRHFVSGFPPSCLVVPFRDTSRIDAICRSVDLQGAQKGVIVDPNGIVVCDSLKYIGSIAFMDSFPSIHRIRTPRPSKTWRNQTLDRLLGCGELTRSHSGDGRVSLSVSDLANNKVVGLYLCGRGQHIPLVHKVYNECRALHLDFEVVLVYVPYIRWYPPQVIQHVIAPYLDEYEIPFWVSPFNYTVSLRLFHMADSCLDDKLFIVSYGKLVEVDGELFLSSLGSSAYPFDRESLIQRALGGIEKLTLESLLEGGSLERGDKPGDEVPATCIKGGNVILFLGIGERLLDLDHLIDKHYGEIKQKHSGFEVVFVCIDDTISPPVEEIISYMPWLVFRPDYSRPHSIIKALSLWGVKPDSCLVAFGVDGHICSLNAAAALRRHGSDAFPFSADLREQIATRLNDCLLFNRYRIGSN